MQNPASALSAAIVPLNGLIRRAHLFDDLDNHVVPLSGLQQGDTVRLARQVDDLWFYCRIERLLECGDLLCTIVDAQSWPDLMLGGIMPGQTYQVSIDCVLSVISPATRADAETATSS